MAKPKRTPQQRERDLRIIARLYVTGEYQHDISRLLFEETKAEYGMLTVQQISYDIKAIKKRWREDTALNLDEMIQKELQKIDAIEQECWIEYRRSKEPRRIQKTETLVGKKSKKETPTKTTRTLQDNIGDPRFLDRISWCINRRCQLLGLDKPVKVAPTMPDGETPYTDDNAKANEQRLAAILAAIAEGVTGDRSGDAKAAGK